MKRWGCGGGGIDGRGGGERWGGVNVRRGEGGRESEDVGIVQINFHLGTCGEIGTTKNMFHTLGFLMSWGTNTFINSSTLHIPRKVELLFTNKRFHWTRIDTSQFEGWMQSWMAHSCDIIFVFLVHVVSMCFNKIWP